MHQCPTRQKEVMSVVRSVFGIAMWTVGLNAWIIVMNRKRNGGGCVNNDMIIWRIIEDIGAIRTKLFLFPFNCSIKL